VKPNQVPKIDTFIAASFRAVRDGKASPQQQAEFFKTLVIDLGAIQQDPFCESERDTSFLLGRQWVGRQVMSICEAPMEALAKRETQQEAIVPKVKKRK